VTWVTPPRHTASAAVTAGRSRASGHGRHLRNADGGGGLNDHPRRRVSTAVPQTSAYLNSLVSFGFHSPPWTSYTVRTLEVVSPYWSKATLPVTPSKETLLIASIVG
jgi:hypothetical protein